MLSTSIIIDCHSWASQLVVMYGVHIHTKFGLGLLVVGPCRSNNAVQKAKSWLSHGQVWCNLAWMVIPQVDSEHYPGSNYIEVYYCGCLGRSPDKSSSKFLRHGGLRIQLLPGMVIRPGVLHKPVVPLWWT